MPIPFRDQDDVEDLGSAAFLRIEVDPARPGFRGALFQINARGEPVEFTYNRVATPNSFLWRPGDIRRSAYKKLASSLLATCSVVPRVIFSPAEDVGSDLFCQDIRVSTPVCRIATGLRAAGFSSLEARETLDQSEPDQEGDADAVHLFWFPEPPADASPARRLTRELHLRGLLLEPFERAATGLNEVYGEATAETP